MRAFTHNLLAASAVLAGIAIMAPTAQAAEVNIYSGRHYDTDRHLYELFTEKTGIEVNLIEGKEDALMERIHAEGDASPADILITVDAGRLWRAENNELFQSIQFLFQLWRLYLSLNLCSSLGC